jgi:hypothetical protein
VGAEVERCQQQQLNFVPTCVSHCQVALADPVKNQTGRKDRLESRSALVAGAVGEGKISDSRRPKGV